MKRLLSFLGVAFAAAFLANAIPAGATLRAVTSGGSGVQLTNSLAADVVLNNVSTFFDGPTVAQGTAGTFLATGKVVLFDPSSSGNKVCELTDGTTRIDSSQVFGVAANVTAPVALSGFIANPAGNLRIRCKDFVSTTSLIKANTSGLGKDSTLTVIRIN